MEYKTICKSDLEACAGIYTEVFNSPPWNERWRFETALARLSDIGATPGFLGIAAVSGNGMQGFLMGHVESFDAGRDYYLKEMCVLPGLQGQGIGTGLLAALKSMLFEAQVARMYLLTARDGPAARFYQKNGFYTNKRMIMMGRRLSGE